MKVNRSEIEEIKKLLQTRIENLEKDSVELKKDNAEQKGKWERLEQYFDSQEVASAIDKVFSKEEYGGRKRETLKDEPFFRFLASVREPANTWAHVRPTNTEKALKALKAFIEVDIEKSSLLDKEQKADFKNKIEKHHSKIIEEIKKINKLGFENSKKRQEIYEN